MKNSRSCKYKNYGSIPQNEYNTNNTEKSTDGAAPMGYGSQADDTTHKQRLPKLRAQHRPERKRGRGWVRSWKVNGWRDESASQEDEFICVVEVPKA